MRSRLPFILILSLLFAAPMYAAPATASDAPTVTAVQAEVYQAVSLFLKSNRSHPVVFKASSRNAGESPDVFEYFFSPSGSSLTRHEGSDVVLCQPFTERTLPCFTRTDSSSFELTRTRYTHRFAQVNAFAAKEFSLDSLKMGSSSPVRGITRSLTASRVRLVLELDWGSSMGSETLTFTLSKDSVVRESVSHYILPSGQPDPVPVKYATVLQRTQPPAMHWPSRFTRAAPGPVQPVPQLISGW